MARRSKQQIEAGVCVKDLHPWIEGQRRCKECHSGWSKENPEKRRATARKWHRENRELSREKSRKWRTENSEKAREVGRKSHFKTKYGIDVNAVLDNCEVCGSGGRIGVDHNHETGLVRGFLCTGCNVAIGMVKDDPARLEKLALYLRERDN